MSAQAGVAAIQSRIGEIETRLSGLNAAFSTARGAAASAALPSAEASGRSAGASTATAASFASVLAGADLMTGAGVDALLGAAATPSVAAPASVSGPAATGADLVAEARKYLGVPYVLGGTTTAGLDCSGLVQRALGALGVDMPRVAREQMTQGTAVASLADAVPGDLLVFDGGSHIGVYVGGGRMIDAPKPGDVVRERDVYATPTTIRRVLGAGTTDPTSTVTAATAALQQAIAAGAAQRSALTLRLGDAA